MSWGSDGLRIATAAIAVLAWLALCGFVARRQRIERLRAASDHAIPALPGAAGTPWLVAFASQTGTAEELAWHTAKRLHAAGVPVRVVELGALAEADLAGAHRALFIVSTYGEGDPPDAAAPFARRFMGRPLSLAPLQFGMLALGDREYVEFCGFGRTLEGWLTRSGARPMFEHVDVDNLDDAALGIWQERLGQQLADAGADTLTDWRPTAWQRWRLVARRHLNPGSAGEPVFHVELQPVGVAAVGGEGVVAGAVAGVVTDGVTDAVTDGVTDDVADAVTEGRASVVAGGFATDVLAPGARPVTQAGRLPSWCSGDLVQVLAPGDESKPRDYSIGSLPADGSVQLLVRQQRRGDGRLGLASGWLTAGCALQGEVVLQIRPHRAFRLAGNQDRPLILIGNGTGLAGLRGHLKARAAHGDGRNWLIFGERQSAFDALYRDELDAWQADGVLERLDLIYSRDIYSRDLNSRDLNSRDHDLPNPDSHNPISRDPPRRRYVQDALRESAHSVREWLAAGAAVYVCGSLAGMAGGVDAALHEIAGTEAVDALTAAGRYRRDVY